MHSSKMLWHVIERIVSLAYLSQKHMLARYSAVYVHRVWKIKDAKQTETGIT